MRTYTYSRWNSPEGKARSFRLCRVGYVYYYLWCMLILFRHGPGRMIGQPLGWPVELATALGGILLLAIVEYIAWRFPGDLRLPSRIDFADDDTLRLYRRGRVYAEIPAVDIASVTADPQDRQGGVALNLSGKVCGAKEILVGPYLIGFSDFVHRLHPPRIIQGTPDPEGRWRTEASTDVTILSVTCLLALVFLASVFLTDGPRLGGVILLIAGLSAVWALSYFVTEIAIRGDRIVVTKGWIRNMTYRSSDVLSFEVIPAGARAERVVVEIGGDRVTISADLTRGYLSLLDRLQEFTQHRSRSCQDAGPGADTDPVRGNEL